MKAYNRYKTKKLLFLQKAPSDAFMTFYEALYANVLFLNFLNTSEPEVQDVFRGYRKGALTCGTFKMSIAKWRKKLVPNFPYRQTL